MSDYQFSVTLVALERADLAILRELQKSYPALSRGALKTIFKEKKICTASGLLSASDDLAPGTHSVSISGWDLQVISAARPEVDTKTLKIPIIFEDDNFLILDKPSGLPSVPKNGNDSQNCVSSALLYLNQTNNFSAVETFLKIGSDAGQPLEGGLLHRLDTGTSGVLAFAKNLETFQTLRQIWKTPQVRKYYRAVVKYHAPSILPNPTKHSLSSAADCVIPNVLSAKLPITLDFPIAHDAKSSKKMVQVNSLKLNAKERRETRGKPLRAITHIIKKKCLGNGFYELELEIETGVMHQIRVHLSSVGLPIVGDPLYFPLKPTATRLLLHHEKLQIILDPSLPLQFVSVPPVGWNASLT